MTDRRPALRRLWTWGSLAILVIGAIAVAWWLDGGEPQAVATPATDVPHLADGHIVLPPAFEKLAGISTSEVRLGRLQPHVRVVGTVTFDPEYVATVGAKANGVVRTIAHFEGDLVAAGDALADIESSDLAEAQAQLTVAAAHLQAAERNLRRERSLLTDGMTSRRDVEAAQAVVAEQTALRAAARQHVAALAHGDVGPLGRYTLRSPLTGTVIERHVHQGQAVEDSHIAFRIADLQHLWVELHLPERFLAHVHRGDRVEIRGITDARTLVNGRVAHVGDVLDPATGTADVRVESLDTKRVLRPGQAVTAAILPAALDHEVVLVPMAAVIQVDGKPTVFVQSAPHQVTPTEVRLGGDDGEFQVVLDGLRPGERVVTEGVFALKSELFR